MIMVKKAGMEFSKRLQSMWRASESIKMPSTINAGVDTLGVTTCNKGEKNNAKQHRMATISVEKPVRAPDSMRAVDSMSPEVGDTPTVAPARMEDASENSALFAWRISPLSLIKPA